MLRFLRRKYGKHAYQLNSLQLLIQFKNDIIECQFECERVSLKRGTLKPQFCLIGVETLYFRKNDQLRTLPLTLTSIRQKIQCKHCLIQLTRNTQTLELLIPNHNQIWQALAMKCIQSTFHDDFYVERVLGQGSSAYVLLAIKQGTRQHFAVKAFSKEYVQNQKKGKESLLNEIIVMRKLKSENIVHLHEVHETVNSIYLVLDYCEGGSLEQLLQRQHRIDIQKIMYNLLKGVHYLHQNGCMHRDLKPSNILFRDNQDIQIADFGLAQFLDRKPIHKKCGTPGYVAPEILNYTSEDKFYNEKCDIFSVGVIFYLLLTGKSVFGKNDIQDVIKKNKNCIINFTEINQRVNYQCIQDILKGMLEKQPHKRFSAIDCLKHSFFQFSTKLDEKKTLDFETETLSSDLPEITSIDSQKESYLGLKDRQIQCNSIGSITMSSDQSSQKQKQLEKPSKFSNLGQAMEQLHKKSQKKQNQDSLHKEVVKKAFLQRMNSLENDSEIEKVVENNVKQNKQWPKKSNSLLI